MPLNPSDLLSLQTIAIEKTGATLVLEDGSYVETYLTKDAVISALGRDGSAIPSTVRERIQALNAELNGLLSQLSSNRDDEKLQYQVALVLEELNYALFEAMHPSMQVTDENGEVRTFALKSNMLGATTNKAFEDVDQLRTSFHRILAEIPKDDRYWLAVQQRILTRLDIHYARQMQGYAKFDQIVPNIMNALIDKFVGERDLLAENAPAAEFFRDFISLGAGTVEQTYLRSLTPPGTAGLSLTQSGDNAGTLVLYRAAKQNASDLILFLKIMKSHDCYLALSTAGQSPENFDRILPDIGLKLIAELNPGEASQSTQAAMPAARLLLTLMPFLRKCLKASENSERLPEHALRQASENAKRILFSPTPAADQPQAGLQTSAVQTKPNYMMALEIEKEAYRIRQEIAESKQNPILSWIGSGSEKRKLQKAADLEGLADRVRTQASPEAYNFTETDKEIMTRHTSPSINPSKTEIALGSLFSPSPGR